MGGMGATVAPEWAEAKVGVGAFMDAGRVRRRHRRCMLVLM
jgi:hypothetical protein